MKKIFITTLLTLSITPVVSLVSCKEKEETKDEGIVVTLKALSEGYFSDNSNELIFKDVTYGTPLNEIEGYETPICYSEDLGFDCWYMLFFESKFNETTPITKSITLYASYIAHIHTANN